MAELWIPGLQDTYDAPNVYDMMLLYQERLDKVNNSDDRTELWREVAVGAMRILGEVIKGMSYEQRQITVATNLAIMVNTENTSSRIKIKDIGLRGALDDAHCMTLGNTIKPSIALGLDVESVYPISDPDDGDMVLTTAITPISKVHYIEHSL